MKSFKQHNEEYNKSTKVGDAISSMTVTLNRIMTTSGYNLLDTKTQSKIKKLRKDMNIIVKDIG
jgi:hypothetical protein